MAELAVILDTELNEDIMAQVTGIRTELHANGSVKAYIIDAKKYGEQLKPFFDEIGYTGQNEAVIDEILAKQTFVSVEESKQLTKRLLREKCRKEGLI
ncbi:hypothetical protein FW774_16100 [Pedobacter sp. BS3]|uniref:hypothetical protein n=1 Tax=Pedobacter sp. BS3 TaxID=2567937 RepID=UPI0011EBCBA3|nr:hypothetical protein [Pedobacter sp. BS3]TZF82211.1 hypothetical protein FW774_16100 [Pedobacter sp. BS3]